MRDAIHHSPFNILYTLKKHIRNILNLLLHFHMASNRLSLLFLQRASFFNEVRKITNRLLCFNYTCYSFVEQAQP